MPGDVLARRVHVPRDLPKPVIAAAAKLAADHGRGPRWTAEQLRAIERRKGDLLLDASAGSGKTSVLVERFARAIVEDEIDVSAILTITFTDKAAAELRDRIRARLRELGAGDAARATEGAFISTIHGFCSRVLRTHALAAGIDPLFSVLDQPDVERLADAAFDDALEDLAQDAPGAVDLIAAYGPGALRGAILATHEQLRSRGAARPELPSLPVTPDLDAARLAVEQAAARAADELGAVPSPGVRVMQALDRLERCLQVIADTDPWPGELEGLTLPGVNGGALTSPVCIEYAHALNGFRRACEHRRAERAHALLDRLLRGFGARFAQLKREASGLDFEDLELITHELLTSDADVKERYASRFALIMVDELQDTNRLQLELIESIARGNLFTVGDAQQSIYAFRHADVELFEQRGERLVSIGGRATLQTNFRSRREILDVLNLAFEAELGERFRPMHCGRSDPPAEEPRVELLILDKGAVWATDGLAAPWRQAEARALAGRVGELIDGGAAPREIVVLTRATTDLRVYERALEELGIPTYVVGGRGYWSHPQVVDLVAYLRALANPRDEEALYAVLASPLVGVSFDGLVLLAAAARTAARDPWWVLREPAQRLDELGCEDRDRLIAFSQWFATERSAVSRLGIEALLDRALERTGYDLAMLRMPGGERRLANVRKLMRLGREHEAAHGRDLRDFLELVRGRSAGWLGDPRESEAPVEGEALDAVRLMTIHRAKGLEFEIVCVADLGRAPRRRADLMRVGRDGRFGLRLAEPGTGRREPALDYVALGEEQLRAEQREERRLFHVAMTRARERLILSGAAKLDGWPSNGSGGPITWIAPALVPDIASRVAEGDGVTDAGVSFKVARPGGQLDRARPVDPRDRQEPAPAREPPPKPLAPLEPAPPLTRLSYSSLGEYERCGYRFYVERVLGLPPVKRRAAPGAATSSGLTAIERGIIAHTLLERVDFGRAFQANRSLLAAARARAGLASAPSAAEEREVVALVDAFATSPLAARLGRATDVRREQRFGFLLGGDVLITGALDVLAREPDGRMLVVDYKSDRLQGGDSADLVAQRYSAQRLIYALAVLRAGAVEVEVAYVFLELPDEPVSATFTDGDTQLLETELTGRAGRVLQGRFAVTDVPHRALCDGCPAEGGLCSWPLELTRRDAPDRLF